MRAPWLLGLCLLGCRAPLPDPGGAPGTPSSGLTVEPPSENDLIHPVSRFRLASPPSEPVLLVRGALSDYHLGKIRDGALPKTLLERLVPTTSWVEEAELVVSPNEVLEPGVVHDLASADRGLIARLAVREDAAPPLARLWPPSAEPGSAEYWLFCGPEPLGVASPTEVFLEPGHRAAWAGSGPIERCIELVAAGAAAEPVVPPLAVLGRALEPAPMAVGARAPMSAASCASGEVTLGPGCLTVLDDRALLRAPAAPTLWSVGGAGASFLEPLAPGTRAVLRGLTPEQTQSLAVDVRDPFGLVFQGSIELTTAPLQPHPVINEVLANPLGAEPASEWVELHNDGLAPVQLAHFELRDSGGGVALPEHWLAPGSFALVAREDFAPAGGPDPVPGPAVTVLRVPSLGKNGLSNSGEALELSGPGGQVVSRFPALPKPKAGVSVARRATWTLDDDPLGFAHHGPPGASPGAPNSFE